MPSTKYFIKKDLIIGIFVLLFACGFGALLFFKVLDYSGSGEQVWMILMLFVLFVIGVTVIVRSIVKPASYKKILAQCVMAEGFYLPDTLILAKDCAIDSESKIKNICLVKDT